MPLSRRGTAVAAWAVLCTLSAAVSGTGAAVPVLGKPVRRPAAAAFLEQPGGGGSGGGGESPLPGWELLWRDEFEGSSLNYKKWDVQVARGCQYGRGSDLCGWGNGELEFYADRPENLQVSQGNLVMTARYEPVPSMFNESTTPDLYYTSARIRTFRKYAVKPDAQYPTIRIEARIQVPAGTGLWPAFWMLPEDGASASCSGCGRYGVWASSGEIDIAELRNGMNEVLGSIHFGSNWPNNKYITHTKAVPGTVANTFHTYAIEWERKQIRWFFDGEQYGVSNSGNGGRAEGTWFSAGSGVTSPDAPFGGDQAFHILLNLAIGGQNTPFTSPLTENDVKATLSQPKSMLVDYVRVFGKGA